MNQSPTAQNTTAIPDKSINFQSVDIIQLLDGLLDLVLIGPDIDDKDKCIILLNLLHGTL